MQQADRSTAAPARIALCVDDIGLHEGIDRGALQLLAGGRATVASALTQGPSWPRSAAALRELAPARADIGLHFNLTQGFASQPALGALAPLIVRAYAHALAREPIRVALQRQLDAFEAGLKRAPAHLDGHQHVQQLPVVRDIVLQTLHQRYGSVRPWLRVGALRPGPAPGARARRAQRKARLIHWLGAGALGQLARQQGWATNRALLGVYDFSGSANDYRALLQLWLQQAGDGDLLMCHAGYRATDSAAHDPHQLARERELQVIDSGDFDRLLAANRIALMPMSRILGS